MMIPSKHPSELDLLAHLDGELDAAQGNDIQAHCAQCNECLELLESFRGIQDRLNNEPVLAVPLPVWAGVEKELRKNRSVNWGPAFGLGLSGAVAAGLALGLLMGEPVNKDGYNQETAAWASTDFLWNSTNDNSLLSTFSMDQAEGSGES